MAERDKPHLIWRNPPIGAPFSPITGGSGDNSRSFAGDRNAHGTRLREEYVDAVGGLDSSAEDEPLGALITFDSFSDLELALDSFDVRRSGPQPELRAVKVEQTAEGPIQRATVFVPIGKKRYFLSVLDTYVASLAADKTKHAKFAEGIRSIRRATIADLWTDSSYEFPPDAGRHWWEVWLVMRDNQEVARLQGFATENQLTLGRQFLGFGNRTVVLLLASNSEISGADSILDDIAELRRPHDVATFIASERAFNQQTWLGELLNHLETAAVEAPAVCLLDTGVQRDHPLLDSSLQVNDMHSADPAWSIHPTHGHGTEMAGLALFGDLESAIGTALPVRLTHRLESVRILPDDEPEHEESKNLYGAITARAVNRAEVEAPRRSRIFSMAVTAPGITLRADQDAEQLLPGTPTSWSATVDALASGQSIDDTAEDFTYLISDDAFSPRLFIISTGNIRQRNAEDDHLDRSDLAPIEDPGQAWNAITVGAYTERDVFDDQTDGFDGWQPIAPRGELAPVSRTSLLFDRKKWPVKPDVVAEGGNWAVDPTGSSIDTPAGLAILTTSKLGVLNSPFTTTRDTSAATSIVASIAARLSAEYPNLWAETIRGLVVHSAEWTAPMLGRLAQAGSRAEQSHLLRRYGMGVPDIIRATKSANDALTLICESSIQPFEQLREVNSGSDGRAAEMNIHDLPWPTLELGNLGETIVNMRVTLSYFIEPNPSRRGWNGRYSYPSHGLRFEVRKSEESTNEFRARINARERTQGQQNDAGSENANEWRFGKNQQKSPGSLHTDVWEGTAADLARRGVLCVYPVTGWWKYNMKRIGNARRVRYSLIVSLATPGVETDIWTPVFNQIELQTPVMVET